MQARDNILQVIGEKLSEMQEQGSYLAMYIDQAYKYRMERLEGLTVPVADQQVHDKTKTKVGAA